MVVPFPGICKQLKIRTYHLAKISLTKSHIRIFFLIILSVPKTLPEVTDHRVTLVIQTVINYFSITKHAHSMVPATRDTRNPSSLPS